MGSLVRLRGVDRRGTRDGYRPSGASAPTPLETLQAAIGVRLIGMWRVPHAADATITINSGRVDSLASLVGGNALAAPVPATNSPLYRTDLSGLSGGAAIEKDGSGRYLEAALAIAAANRAGLYVVGRPSNTSANFLHAATINGADDSNVGYNYGSGYTHKAAFTTAGEVTVTNPTVVLHRWDLQGILPLASGALARLNRATVASNWATTNTMRQVATVRAGHTAASGAGFLKSVYVVADATIADETAIYDYEVAEGVLLGQALPSLVYEGQSNISRLLTADIAETAGYHTVRLGFSGAGIGDWDKATGALYTPFLQQLQYVVATGKRPIVVWGQGEADTGTVPRSSGHLAAFEALRTNLETDLGQGSNYIYWIVWRFHNSFLANGAYPYASVVDAGLGTFVTNHAGHATQIFPSDSGYGLEADNIHHGPIGGPTTPLQQWMTNASGAAALAAGLL